MSQNSTRINYRTLSDRELARYAYTLWDPSSGLPPALQREIVRRFDGRVSRSEPAQFPLSIPA